MEQAGKTAMMIRGKGIKATPQRVAVLDCLLGSKVHPTATAIYESLRVQMPSITKATVYNCIAALCEAGLATQLSVDGTEARYDAMMAPHGHIKCLECGRVDNIETDPDQFEAAVPEGFEVIRKEVIFTGICSDCRHNKRRR